MKGAAMGKSNHNDVLDAIGQYYINHCDKMVLCSQEPLTFVEANSTYFLAGVAMAAGDQALADGDTSGRKVTTAAKSGVPVTNTGTSNHCALLDTVNSKLLRVTTHTAQALTAGNTVDIGAYKEETADPT
jgi:hypothetical protein